MSFAMVLLQNQPDPEQAMRALMAIIPLIGLFVLIGMAIVIVPFWFICKKAGFSPWLSLLNLIPLGNLILIYILAFADWKVMPAPSATQMGYPFPPPPQS